jgi:hypothetical protein
MGDVIFVWTEVSDSLGESRLLVTSPVKVPLLIREDALEESWQDKGSTTTTGLEVEASKTESPEWLLEIWVGYWNVNETVSYVPPEMAEAKPAALRKRINKQL